MTSYIYLTSSGVIVPDTSTTLAQVQGEYQQAFGADLIVTPDTPQGVLITAEALARDNVIRNNAQVANQINPNIAGGVFLDAILALTGVERNAQTPTVVSGVTLTGVASTVIPEGSIAQTSAGDQFKTMAAATLSIGGTTNVDFASIENGPIPCAAHALNIIVSSVLGWETVDNSNVGVLGTTTQSDQSARAFRLNTLSFNGISLAEAITSALYHVEDVTSLSFRENYNSVPMGMLIHVTDGATLDDTIWGLVTTGTIIVATTAITFAESEQTLPVPNPWPAAAFTTTGNITLSGLATQGGGDWAGTLTAGNIILVKDQGTPAQNGLYVAAAGAWARQSYAAVGDILIGSNDGISMIDHSVYACVDGGSDTDVAAALLESKSSGCAWNGGEIINLIEPASGQSYAVQFDRPTEVIILVNVHASNVTDQAVKDAIVDYANGDINGLAGLVVGADVSPFELSGAVMAENPGAYVSAVTISLSSPISYSTDPISIGLNEIGSITENNIVVVIT